MLDSNLAKLKDRQTPDIAIRLIVADILKTTVGIKKIKQIDKSFAFAIMTKGYLYQTLENQLQNNIAKHSLKMPKTDTTFLDITKHCSQYIYKIYKNQN